MLPQLGVPLSMELVLLCSGGSTSLVSFSYVSCFIDRALPQIRTQFMQSIPSSTMDQFRIHLNSTSALYVLLVATGGLVALLIIHSISSALLSPLRQQPGPFFARFSRLWYLEKVWRGDFESTNIGLHKKYGKLALMYSKHI